MIADFLATTSPDPQISGNWLIAVIGALSTAAALIIGKLQGRKEAETRDVNIKKPVPTIQTREEPRWATREELQEYIRRTDKVLSEIKQQTNADIVAIHERINQQSTVLAETKGTVHQIDKKVDQLLDIELRDKG